MANEKLSESTKKHYEDLISRIGDDYIEYRWKRNPVSFSHYRHTQIAVEFAFNRVDKPIGHTLEIGCGPGTWTDICLRNTRLMTIVDISDEMIKLVRNRFRNDCLDFFCGDFLSETIVFEYCFDVIFSARALEYMDNKEAVVAKSVRCLNPGGYLLIITKNPEWIDKKRKSKTNVGARNADIQSDWISWAVLENLYRSYGLTGVNSFPVCLGSYYFPLKNRIGIKLCDLIQSRIYRRRISSRFDFLAESYLTIGRKPSSG